MEGLSVRKGGKAGIGVVKVELRCNIGVLIIRTEFGGILYFNSAVFSQTMRDYRHGSRALNGSRMYRTCSRPRLQSSEKQTVSDSHSTCSLVLNVGNAVQAMRLYILALLDHITDGMILRLGSIILQVVSATYSIDAVPNMGYMVV